MSTFRERRSQWRKRVEIDMVMFESPEDHPMLSAPEVLELLDALDRIEALADDLWSESQADQCRIREAGVMQDHVDRLRAVTALGGDTLDGDPIVHDKDWS